MLAHHIAFYLSGRPRKAIMSELPTGRHGDAGQYEIRLKGHLHSRWAAWFEGLSLTNASDGTTIIHGPVADQAALHGLLRKVRDVGLPLVSVTQVEPDQIHTKRNPI